jgi:hypothetical protein
MTVRPRQPAPPLDQMLRAVDVVTERKMPARGEA